MDSLVSIIIPCYNYEKYLYNCVLSCIEQSYQNIEIIVIDDCSDGSPPKVSIMSDKVSIYYNEKNMGYSFCKNVGIRKSRGKFIVHLDADDMLTKHSVASRLEAFLKYPDLDFVHANSYRFYGDKSLEWCQKNEYILKTHQNVQVHSQTWMVKRSVYEKYGLYCSHMRSKSDKEMLWRWGLCKGQEPRIKAMKISDIVAYYRRHDKAMIMYRKDHPEYDAEIERMFGDRQKIYETEGITAENTEML